MNPTLKQRLKLAFKPEIFLATPQPASTPATAAAVETSRLEKIADPNSMFFWVDAGRWEGLGTLPSGSEVYSGALICKSLQIISFFNINQ